MLFAARGTTDLTTCSIMWATEGVQDFLQNVLKIDPQDFLCKMEGFAIQGLRGEQSSSELVLIA